MHIGPHDDVHCPYYWAHIYPLSSEWKHLVKCERNWLNDPHVQDRKKMVTCRYNPLHHFPLDEIVKHQMFCETRIIEELPKNKSEEEQQEMESKTIPVEKTLTASKANEEDWDCEDAPGILNLVQICSKSKDGYQLQQNASKAALRKMQAEERARLDRVEAEREMQQEKERLNRAASSSKGFDISGWVKNAKVNVTPMSEAMSMMKLDGAEAGHCDDEGEAYPPHRRVMGKPNTASANAPRGRGFRQRKN